jgi:hypothetical protein
MGRGARSAAVALLLLVCAGRAAAEVPPEPRATMRRVFDALLVLLPASLDLDHFGDPAQRDALQGAFEQLAAASGELARHGEGAEDAAFAALSRSLAADADAAAGRFARGRVDDAAFRLQQLTQRCVACHSRLPKARDFPLANRLLARVEAAELPPEERARLLVATRRFDGALAAYEAMFADPAVAPGTLDQGGQLSDYLTVAVRVADDLVRPERALRALAARADAPRSLAARATRYADQLAELRGPAPAAAPLARAEALVERSRAPVEFPTARDGLVYDLYASALLNRAVAARGRPAGEDAELARALWLLAALEDRTAWSSWVPQTEAYLEATLAAAPHGPLAPRAYERLEEIVLFDYGAYGLDQLPAEARARLAELSQRMEAPTP